MEMLPHVKLNPNFNKYDGSNNPPPFKKGDFVWIYFPKVKVCGTQKSSYITSVAPTYCFKKTDGMSILKHKVHMN